MRQREAKMREWQKEWGWERRREEAERGERDRDRWTLVITWWFMTERSSRSPLISHRNSSFFYLFFHFSPHEWARSVCVHVYVCVSRGRSFTHSPLLLSSFPVTEIWSFWTRFSLPIQVISLSLSSFLSPSPSLPPHIVSPVLLLFPSSFSLPHPSLSLSLSITPAKPLYFWQTALLLSAVIWIWWHGGLRQ